MPCKRAQRLQGKEVEHRLENRFKQRFFYDWPELTIEGDLKDSPGRPDTDLIAEWLLGRSDEVTDALFAGPPFAGDGSELERHGRVHTLAGALGKVRDETTQHEPAIAKRLFVLFGERDVCPQGRPFEGEDGRPYRVADYQVPICWKRPWLKRAADLVIVDEDHTVTIIGELKRYPTNRERAGSEGGLGRESLLRAMAEAKTYCEWVLASEHHPEPRAIDRFGEAYGSRDIRPAVLADRDSRPYREFMRLGEPGYSNLRKLAELWGIRFFEVTCEEGGLRDYEGDHFRTAPLGVREVQPR